ncbi:MAG: outer membrane lipoprotein-sorting protein [Bdellovibrionaceae bacterium]|nr:outer membrane lipoprotein-sorting protein [Pseudobdellovibrionaceae bacterium]
MIFLSLLLSVSVWAAAPTADEIVQKADEGRIPGGNITLVATVNDYVKKEEVRETRYRISIKGKQASLVETIFPERQTGRKYLMVGNDLWFYTPDTKRPARVSMQQKLTGEVSNGDLARADFAGDYDAKLVGKETLKGQPAFKLLLTAKRPDITYSKLDYWVHEKTFLPMKVTFYAVSGKPLKRGQYSAIKDIFGRKRVTKMLIEDAIDPERQSILSYSQHKRAELPDSMFRKESFGE